MNAIADEFMWSVDDRSIAKMRVFAKTLVDEQLHEARMPHRRNPGF